MAKTKRRNCRRNRTKKQRGGVDYNTISKILGYSLGVAITGTENTTTLILTEGFGEINMAERTFNLLKGNEKTFRIC